MHFTAAPLASLAAVIVIALSAGATAQETQALYQPQALAEDLAVLRTAINEGHPGALRYLTATELQGEFDAAVGRIVGPMDALSFYRIVAPVVAALRDGHTAIDLSEADSAVFVDDAPLIPLRVLVNDGRLFVLRDLSGGDLAGREIVTINGEPVRDVLANMMQVTPGDGGIVSGREHRLSTGLQFNRLYSLLRGPNATYQVEVRRRFGLRSRALEGMSLAALDQAWLERFPTDRATHPPAELSYRDEGAIALLTIRNFGGFADLAHQQRLDAFFAETFRDIKARRTRTLVIDLRDNGGGRDELGRQLFAYLAAEPFRYYAGLYLRSSAFSFSQYADPPIPGPPPNLYETDVEGRLRWLENPNYGVHQPEADRFSGRVFVLMNGGSFSTTAEFLSVAHSNRRAVFIGEEAAGGYYGNTSGVAMMVTLPNTGIRLHLPLQRYEVAVAGFSHADRGVPPDHRVIERVEDVLTGRDRAMQTAFRLARRRN
jgi:hypothetical protein